MRKLIDFIKKEISALVKIKNENEIVGLTIFVVVYGLVLNYIAFVLFNLVFAWYTFIGYGLAWYFTKYELVRLFHMFRGINR